MTAAAINDLIVSKGYGTGTITEVVAGNGLSGGGLSGTVTLTVGAGPGIIANPDNVAVDVSFIESIAPQGTLDSVTDNGNTTSNAITVGTLNTTTISFRWYCYIWIH